MMQNTPLVSVIMPAYNAERFIRQAIQSVVDQTMTDWELLVLDDASTDTTTAIVEDMLRDDSRIKLIKSDANVGVARIRNLGWNQSNGRYIAFLDSDDLWQPNKLDEQLKKMQETGAAIGYCSYAMIDAEDRRVHADYTVPSAVDYDVLLKENVIGCSTVVLDNQQVNEYRFSTEYYHEDYVLWLQLLKAGYKAVGCTDTLVCWRHLENSRSFNKLKAAKNRWIIYRKCMGISPAESFSLLWSYAFAGIKKYQK